MKRRVLLVPLLLAGCAGPQPGVTIGGKAVAVDVAFGLPPRTVVPLPPESRVLVPVPNGLGVLPVPTTSLPPARPSSPAPPLPGPACPAPPLGAFPKDAATPVVVGVPALASYRVRYSAKVTQDGVTRTFSGIARHTVTASTALPGGASTFDVRVSMLGADTTFTWTTVPTTYNAAGASGGQIALQSAAGSAGLGYEASFHPANPLQVFPQPAFTGATFTSAGTDAQNGAVARHDGTVRDHVVINACGTPLDAWSVSSTLVTHSPNQELTTVLTTAFATAHGGLPISQTETYTGTAGGKAVSGSFTWTFSDAVKAALR